MASAGDMMVPGEGKNREHWRFISVQARGCLAVTRRSDKQREQQLQLAGYLARRECEIVGIGDTRLGGDASELTKLTRAALRDLRSADDRTTADRASSFTRPRPSRTCDVVRNNDISSNVSNNNTEYGNGRDGYIPSGASSSNTYDDTMIHNDSNDKTVKSNSFGENKC